MSGAVAHDAEGSHVSEVALTAAGSDGDDVVGIPEMAPKAPILFELLAGLVVEFALIFAQLLGIDAAERADSSIAGKDLLAQVAGIGAELPFVDARVAAKSEAIGGHFAAAPAAGAALALDPTTWLGAAGAHTRSS